MAQSCSARSLHRQSFLGDAFIVFASGLINHTQAERKKNTHRANYLCSFSSPVSTTTSVSPFFTALSTYHLFVLFPCLFSALLLWRQHLLEKSLYLRSQRPKGDFHRTTRASVSHGGRHEPRRSSFIRASSTFWPETSEISCHDNTLGPSQNGAESHSSVDCDTAGRVRCLTTSAFGSNTY